MISSKLSIGLSAFLSFINLKITAFGAPFAFDLLFLTFFVSTSWVFYSIKRTSSSSFSKSCSLENSSSNINISASPYSLPDSSLSSHSSPSTTLPYKSTTLLNIFDPLLIMCGKMFDRFMLSLFDMFAIVDEGLLSSSSSLFYYYYYYLSEISVLFLRVLLPHAHTVLKAKL